jgi:hypothetical protein
LSETTITIVFSRLAGLLEVIEQPSDLVVRVGQEAGVDLGHPAEQPSLFRRKRRPGTGEVERPVRLAVGPGAGLWRSDRVQQRQLCVGRDDAHGLLAGQRLGAHRLVARVEAALEAVDPSLWRLVGAWQAPGA